ncbi:MAG: nitronate monooxygenase family protein [Bdellovibrionota bacterium]
MNQKLFKIELPIVQGGMVYCSGGRLAGSVSEAGGLGLIGAGSMNESILQLQIDKAQRITKKPIGINIPLLYSKVENQIEIALNAGIKIFFTSAGNPKTYTSFLKRNGCTVVHVTSTPELAKKCEAAGVDAIVAEGFEAGGHHGREEITTLALIPQVVQAVKIPVIAAGGIASGGGIAAALSLGAAGVQMGSRFAATQESSAHDNFKRAIINMHANDTMLCMKKLVPVRLYKNEFFNKIHTAESRCASKDELSEILGKGKARSGMLDGDIENGEIEIGQISGYIDDIPTVATLIQRLREEYQQAVAKLEKTL